ncbi:MAG: DUF2341 domain-containing protein [Thermoplasmata archaeon]|nr:DUF2341 domain-containing protein [Thermoplasmata archaeon]
MKPQIKKIFGEIGALFIILIFVGDKIGIGMYSENVKNLEEESIFLSYSFNKIEIKKITLYNETFYRIQLDNLPLLNEPQKPRLPFKPVKILLPPGHRVTSIKILLGERKEIGTVSYVEPALKPIPYLDGIKKDNGSPIVSKALLLNFTVYGSLETFPGNFYSVMGVQKFRGYSILLLNLYPIQYIPKTGELYYYPEMKIEVHTREGEILKNFRGFSEDMERILKIVDNPEMVNAYFTSSIPSVDKTTYKYVIITTSSLKPAFQKLANWKETRGKYTPYQNLTTKIVLVEDIINNATFWYDGEWGDGVSESIFNDTACKIRNFIKMAYNEWGTEYVLLGGDADGPEDSPKAIIPHRGMYVYAGSYTDYDIPSDMYFGCLDGNWNDDGDDKWGEPGEADLFAEVYIGRAPVDSLIQAWNFVNKTIAYENATAHDEDYLKKALMIGPASDEKTEEGNSKDKVTEIIPQYTTTKVYHRDGTYSKSTIIQEMENGTHIVNYNGHSSSYCFASSICINDVDSLTNNKYFLVYSCGCYSADFDNRSTSPGNYDDNDAVGEHFVTASGGAFAYIGNSRYGWYVPGSTEGPGAKYDRSFFLALMNNATNVGKALQLSKENLLVLDGYMDRWTYYDLNLLGDPETQIKINLSAPTAHFSTVKSYRLMPPIYSGTIAINGIACRGAETGATFSHYVIEYGAGLHPSAWSVAGITLVNGGNSEVINGVLAYWDTTQVSDGYYTLRLTVYDDNGKIGRDWFVVIISNAFTVHNINKDTYYNSIQAAIDDANNGDTIFVGARTYYEVLMITHSINLVGESSENTILDATPCGGIGAITISCTSMVNVSGFRIEKNHGIGICAIDSNHICIFNNTIWNQDDSAIEIASSSYCKIYNNRLYDSEKGIWIVYRLNGIGPSNYNIISNNFIMGCQIAGIWIWSSHYNTVTDCTIIGSSGYSNSYGISLIFDSSNNSIYHNNFINNVRNAHDEGNNNKWDNGYPSGGNYWSDFDEPSEGAYDNNSDGIVDEQYNIPGGSSKDRYPLANPVNFTIPTIVYVDDDFDASTPGWEYDHFKEISHGVGMVKDGGTVYVFNGTYNGFSIWRGKINLIGEDKNSTIIDGCGEEETISIEGDKICISNFTISNATWGIEISREKKDIVIKDNIIMHNYGGIYFWESSFNITIMNNIIINNTYGIHAYSSSNNHIVGNKILNNSDYGIELNDCNNNSIYNCNISNNNGYGIYLHSSNNNSIYNCNIMENNKHGLLLYTSSNNSVYDCNTINNNWSGIYLYSSNSNSICNCNASSNNHHGILLYTSSDNSVYNCKLSSNNYEGIYFYFSNNNKIFNCIISENKMYGIYSNSNSNHIYHNNFINNKYVNAYDEGSNTWDNGYPSGGNYWDDYTGNDGNGDGIGDTPYSIPGGNTDRYPLMEPWNIPPFAYFTYSIDNRTVYFDASSSNDIDGNIVSYEWSFGDGTTGTGMTISHTYTKSGTYIVKLTVTDNKGKKNDTSKNIIILNTPPVADFIYSPSNPTPADVIQFIDKSYDNDGYIVNWTWDFGDGNISYEQNPSHKYEHEGTYNVTLIVKDNNGAINSTYKHINVENAPPIADFSYSPCDLYEIQFIDKSYDNDGSLVNWTWDFGDGNISYEQNPKHKYAEQGIYAVTLTVKDDDGAIASTTKTIGVWIYRKPINLWVSSGKTPSYYQVLLNISYNASMNPDFSDLRFIRYADNTTELDYWIERKVDRNWCRVWVEIADEITATNKTLAWMYYGNEYAASASNGSATFLFFDDFDDGIWRDKWSIDKNTDGIGLVYQLNGKLFLRTKEIGRTISIISKNSFDVAFYERNGTVLEYDVWTRYNPPYPKGKDGKLSSYIINKNKWIMASYSSWNGNVKLESNNDYTMLGRTSRRTSNIHAFVSLKCNMSNAWMRWKEIDDPAWIEDDFNGSIAVDMSNITSMKVKLELHCGGKQEGKWSQIAFDNVRVRKYYYEEPSYYIGDAQHKSISIQAGDDANANKRVNVLDLIALAMHFGKHEGEDGYEASADLNRDGIIDVLDLIILAMREAA